MTENIFTAYRNVPWEQRDSYEDKQQAIQQPAFLKFLRDLECQHVNGKIKTTGLKIFEITATNDGVFIGAWLH